MQPQYTLTVLQLLTEERLELPVRQAGAVFFKNLVKQHWAPEDETSFTIPADVKGQVREGLLRLILFVPELLQSQLSEALALVAKHDFPQQWPTLLPEVVSQIEGSITATPKNYGQLVRKPACPPTALSLLPPVTQPARMSFLCPSSISSHPHA